MFIFKETNSKKQQFECNLTPSFQVEGTQPWTIHQRMNDLNIPNVSIAVIEDGKQSWSQEYSLDEQSNAHNIYQAASISKIFTAVLAMKTLVESGLVGLDEDVNKHLKSEWRVPNSFGKPVTLRGLLSHTGGINVRGLLGYPSNHSTYPNVLDVLKGNESLDTDLREPQDFPDRVPNHPPVKVVTEPGTEFAYSGGGMTIVQKLIEDVTGKPFAKLAQELIFNPLEMQNSSFEVKTSHYDGPFMIGHDDKGNPIEGEWRIHPELGAAGLWSTAEDLAKFANMLLKTFKGEMDTFLKPESLRDMLVKQKNSSFGLGFSLYPFGNKTAFGHGGSNIGYKCQITIFPETNAAFVIMTNADNGTELIEACQNSLLDTYQWAEPNRTIKKTITLREHDLTSCLGEYEYDFKGKKYPLKLTFEDKKIFVTVPFPSFDSQNSVKKIELLAESDHAFFNSQYKMTLVFDHDYKTAQYFAFSVKKVENALDSQCADSNIKMIKAMTKCSEKNKESVRTTQDDNSNNPTETEQPELDKSVKNDEEEHVFNPNPF
mgnify:CR=1 FL=1